MLENIKDKRATIEASQNCRTSGWDQLRGNDPHNPWIIYTCIRGHKGMMA